MVRRTVLIVVGALVVAAGAAAGQRAPSGVPTSPLDGLPIVSIRFIRHNVFDTGNPATSGWVYRAANALHVVTRESYLRARILFEVGDPYSEDLARESARVLRELGWLNPVTVTAHRLGDGVEVVVETHDLWTLQIGAQTGIFGGSTRTGFTIWEQNLLGLGKEINVSRKSTFEHDEWTYFYYDPDLAGTRKQLRIEHQDTSDGTHDEGWLSLPFFSLDSRRGWKLSFVSQHMDEYLWRLGDKAVGGLHTISAVSAWYGWRLGSRETAANRISLGWDHRIDGFGGWRWLDSDLPYPDPEDRHIEGPSFGFQHISDRYEVVQGFRAWTSQEDVAMGPNLDVNLTWSLPGLGDGRTRIPFSARWHRGWHPGRWLLLTDLWTSGRLERGGTRNWRTGGQVVAARLGTEGWQARLMAENVEDADRELQLPLGTFTGLRGWDPWQFAGTGRALLNLQWRRLLREDVFHLLSVGMEVFVDVGSTWNSPIATSTGGVRSDLGIGLVADLTHIGLAHLIRLDIAVPDDGSGVTVTGTSHVLF